MNKNKLIHYLFLLSTLLITILLQFGCGDDNIVSGGPYIDPTILRTDSLGHVLGGDTTDWCYHGGNGLSFPPVFPNPVYTSCELDFGMPSADTIQMYFLKSSTDTMFIYNGYIAPGQYRVVFSVGDYLHNATRRIYFKPKVHYNNSPYCRYYGDIQFY